MKETVSPIGESQRLHWIDAARGFAILGIFMVNVPAYNAPFFLYGGADQYWPSSTDSFVQASIDIFFQASFYTLFSFLFGFGMQMIVEKLGERQLRVHTYVLRRLVILIIFGMIHAFLIWHGDILLSYGIIGLLLLFFFKRKNITLIVWAFCLLLIPAFLLTGLLFLASLIEPLEIVNQVRINQSFENYGNGTLSDIWQQNLQDWLYANGIFGYILLACNLLPLFLFGIFTARKKWLHDVNQHKRTLKKIWIISLFMFLVLKAGPHLFGNPYWFSILQDYVGGSASAIFYLTTITLAFQKENWRKILQPLTYVGKMSLSNYIFQSIICFIAFYSVGFGFYGKVSPLASVLFVLVVYTIQIFLSKWWLKYFQFGPLEWVWRRLMYLTKLNNKRQLDQERKRA